MIFRYHVVCPGCEARIVLRLGVGLDDHQPFYFVCGRCGAPTHGILHIDPPAAELELEDGEISGEFSEQPDQIITISLDFPCLIFGDETPESVFPFLHQGMLMGGLDKVIEFQRRVGMFRHWIKSDWLKVRRLISYYSDRNWQQFDAGWTDIFDNESWSAPTNNFQRHDYFHRLLDLLFAPLEPEFDYPVLKIEFNGLISKLLGRRSDVLRSFTSHLAHSPDLHQHQRNLLERISFVVDNFSALSSGFPVLFYTRESRHRLDQLRIMRDDFEVLKAHYLSCFEICHKVIAILVGMLNINAREDPDAFDGGRPRSLARFEKLPNARKPAFLDSNVIPELSSRWRDHLNRQLRNAIGHYGVYHDLRSGMLVLENADPIPYSWFVASTLQLLPILLYCLQLIKMVYIIGLFLKAECESDGAA